MQIDAKPPILFFKGHRDVYRWGQVASVQLTNCFSLVPKVRISGAVSIFSTLLHSVLKDNFTYMFIFDILVETSVGLVSVTVSEFNANLKVPVSFSKTYMLLSSWKST